jgi:hypothetical protein
MQDTITRSAYEEWLAPVAGVAFVVLAAVAFLLDRGVTGAVDPEQFVAHYTLNATAIQWQVYIYAIAGLPFIAYYANFAQRLQLAVPGLGYLGTMIVSGAVLTFGLQLLWSATRLVLTQEAEFGPNPAFFDTVQLGNAASTLTSLTAVLIVVGVSAGVLRSRLLPPLYGFAGLILTGLLLVNGVLQVQSAGDWDGLGDATFFTFLLWAVVGAFLLRLAASAATLLPADDPQANRTI